MSSLDERIHGASTHGSFGLRRDQFRFLDSLAILSCLVPELAPVQPTCCERGDSSVQNPERFSEALSPCCLSLRTRHVAFSTPSVQLASESTSRIDVLDVFDCHRTVRGSKSPQGRAPGNRTLIDRLRAGCSPIELVPRRSTSLPLPSFRLRCRRRILESWDSI